MFQKSAIGLFSAFFLSAVSCVLTAKAQTVVGATEEYGEEIVATQGQGAVRFSYDNSLPGYTASMQAYERGREVGLILHHHSDELFGPVSNISFEYKKFLKLEEATLDPVFRIEFKEGDKFVYQQYAVHTDTYGKIVSSPVIHFDPPVYIRRAACVGAGTAGPGIPRTGSTTVLLVFVRFLVNGTNPVQTIDTTIRRVSADPLIQVGSP